MEKPIEKKGLKRASSLMEEEEECEMAASAQEKIEKKEIPNPVIQSKPLELLDLPVELIPAVSKALKYEKGATEQHALYKAAENIRNLYFTNMAFRKFLDDEHGTGILVKALADRFAGGNIVRGAMALATDTASKWLAQHYDDEKIQAQAITQLNLASIDGQIGLVRFLLQYMPRNHLIMNGPDDMASPLIHAIINDRIAIAKLLIDSGADIEKNDMEGETALIKAARVNNSAMVDELIKAHANVDAQNEVGFTALMIAALKGHIQVLNKLLAAYASIDLVDEYDRVALHHAVSGQNENIVQRLLAIPGIDVDVRDENGTTPLMMAVRGALPIVKLLLDAHANAIRMMKMSIQCYGMQTNQIILIGTKLLLS